MRRQATEVGERLGDGAFGVDPDRAGGAVISEAADALIDLTREAAGGASRSAPLGASIGCVLQDVDDAAQGMRKPGLSTGLSTLDAVWRGLWPATLDILAGRPGGGKTALALQIARAAAERLVSAAEGKTPRTVDFWSLEMKAEALTARALSMETGIPTDDIREGRIDIAQASALVRAGQLWSPLPIVVHEAAAVTLSGLAVHARADYRRTRTGLLVVDQARKIRRGPGDNRTDEAVWLDRVASELHDLALALDIPVLLLWHMSRDTARRENPRPVLSDLMYAGEKDADNVILLWQPSPQLSTEPPKRGAGTDEKYNKERRDWQAEKDRWNSRAEAVFAKRRSGPEGAVELGFEERATRFYDLSDAAQPSDLCERAA